MTLRRGKLAWEQASFSVICDRCHKPRNAGDHTSCSEERKKARARETVAEVKRELLEMMNDQQPKPEKHHEH